MPVAILNIDTNFVVPQKKRIKNWVIQCLEHFNYEIGDITIAVCSDEYILETNKKYLNHNYFTDVITFPYSEGNIVSGDILISIDTIKSNAKLYNQKLNKELHRVIIHGVLHLIGFNDSTEQEIQTMRNEENRWLEKLQF